MTDLRQAAKAVVDRWDTPAWEWSQQGPTADLMADLRKALTQPEQEPAATTAAAHVKNECGYCVFHTAVPNDTKLYTTPPAAQRPWVGLTDENKEFIANRASVYDWHDYEVIEATEAYLKEKNT